MPLLKGTAGKAMPDMAIGYITRKDKAKYIDVQNLFIDEDYAAQFKETAARFGKYTDYDERKYYHFKLFDSGQYFLLFARLQIAVPQCLVEIVSLSF